MRLKKGVKIRGVVAELAFVMPAINDVVEKYDTIEGCMITSVTEGKHSKGSRHYIGCAMDIRIRNMAKADPKKCVKALKMALGKDFDVVLERHHIHIEYDPKHS